jgi:asparagine synthase (glutamine-hydrolysing)
MMLSDLGGYLPDDVLVKLDRASMAVSLEARAPFLDHELVEFAWRLPAQLKIRSGQGKWVLRQLLARYLPKSLFERPKMGFAIPVDAWLRNPLRDWAEAMLDPSRLGSHGLLDTEAIRRCWHEHVIEGRQRQAQLWDVLMFQAWYEESFG